MFAIVVYPELTLWSAPGLTEGEAHATVAYWRREGTKCYTVAVSDGSVNFEVIDE